MFAAVSVDMIEREELIPMFTATGALAPVLLDGLLANPSVASPLMDG